MLEHWQDDPTVGLKIIKSLEMQAVQNRKMLVGRCKLFHLTDFSAKCAYRGWHSNRKMKSIAVMASLSAAYGS